MEGIARQFPTAAGYLNTASLGIPPADAVTALEAAIARWAGGETSPPDYDEHVADSRRLFAAMVGVPEAAVAVGSQVSGFVGLIAASLPDDALVVCPEGEFTSVLFPFLVQEGRGISVRIVPFERLADAVAEGAEAVAFSAVRSDDGRIADLPAIADAAGSTACLTIVDATQAAGWLPLRAGDFDVVVAGAYKWLLSPRGTAFMSVGADMLAQIVPAHAGWYAGERPWESIYGIPLRLAGDARRFDLSPAWLSWVGTAPALRLITDTGIDTIHRHDVGLADMFCDRMGLDPQGSAIVSLSIPPGFDPGAAHGVRLAERAGRLRLCFHLYNTEEDVERAVAALRS
jgi:selenocysteine lyase/cysteine desulfurase